MPRIVRLIRPTTLVVGEGDAECILLKMLRDGLCSQRKGPSVTIRNAKGKGAKSVINDAIRIGKHGSYNTVAALFDTDTDWSDKTRSLGAKAKIIMLTQTPCIEGVVLQVNQHATSNTTEACKREFERIYGGPAHTHLKRSVSLDALLEAEQRVPEIHSLIGIFR